MNSIGDFVGILFFIICCVLRDLLRRGVPPRQFVRRPILDVDLAKHRRIPLDERLPHFPAPGPAELAAFNTRPFVWLRCSPPRSPAMNIRKQQILSPRQRQNAHHRLPYQYPVPTSLPTTPVSPAPVTPLHSPALDLAQHRKRFNSINVDKSPRPASPLHSPSFIAGPPRSPLARAASPTVGFPGLLASPWRQEQVADSTSMEPVLPITLPFSSPVPTHPQSQTILSEESFTMCPEILALPPAPAPTPNDMFVYVPSESPPHPPPVRRCPSFSSFVATPLSTVLEVPEPSGAAKKTNKKRHSLAITPSASPFGSPLIPQVYFATPLTLSPEKRPSADSKEGSEPAARGKTVEPDVDSMADTESRVPFSDVRNTAATPTRKPDVFDLPVFDPSRLDPPPANLAALISPVKVPRHVDRGPNPVYHYYAGAPAVAIAKSIARPAQDDFKNFSAALGAKFGLKGWSESAPNELAPRVKKKKNKKKKVVVNGRVQPKVSVSMAGHRAAPPSTVKQLLPAFKQTNHGNPLLRSPVIIDLTSPLGVDRGVVKHASGERAVDAECHPDCADIYCPGGCSATKRE
ncbi:hypothetical protein DFH07DRAFT_831965 [Mycena maculata]|uniref:Uncharacterized protein n=1 Tax=Mycena maculata TaxID=230809 RepID=A0AAD7N5X7_9AGAR|nr:hypothetical protein DFH07DRAFT_831965 [Mycena maculata]